MDNSTFGNYLSVAVVGAVIATPSLPYLHRLFGGAYIIMIGFLFLGVSFTILCINSTNAIFALGMIILGFASIIVYSATIAQGSLVEKRVSQQWMGTFSGISGIGGLAGGLIGGWVLEYTSFAVWEEALICSIVACVLCLICYPFLYHKEEEDQIVHKHDSTSDKTNIWVDFFCCNTNFFSTIEEAIHEEEIRPLVSIDSASATASDFQKHDAPTKSNVSYKRDWLGMWLICVIASLASIIEASVGDWSGIYLIDHWDCGYFIGIMGYIAQKVAMLIAGYTCDYVVDHYSKYLLFQLSIAISAVGLTISFLAYFMPENDLSLWIAIFGFFVSGFGIGWNIPMWYSISGGGIRGFSVIQTSSIVMTISNSCYFVGPALFGNFAVFCGDTAYAFGSEIVLAILMALCAFALPRHYFDSLKEDKTTCSESSSAEENKESTLYNKDENAVH